VHLESKEATLGPFCINCLVTRVLQGAIDEPSFARPGAKKIRKLSRRQEHEVMNGIGGKVQPGSGCVDGYKSDGRLRDKVRVEAKFTFGTIYPVKRVDLDKIRGECQGHERPAFVIDFKERVTGKTQDRWVLIPHKDWENMINGATEHSGS
jgi:hypothetical protein